MAPVTEFRLSCFGESAVCIARAESDQAWFGRQVVRREVELWRLLASAFSRTHCPRWVDSAES